MLFFLLEKQGKTALAEFGNAGVSPFFSPSLENPVLRSISGILGCQTPAIPDFLCFRAPGEPQSLPRYQGRDQSASLKEQMWQIPGISAPTLFGRGDCHNKLELLPGFGTGVTLPEQGGIAGPSLFLSGIPAPPPRIWEYPHDPGLTQGSFHLPEV